MKPVTPQTDQVHDVRVDRAGAAEGTGDHAQTVTKGSAMRRWWIQWAQRRLNEEMLERVDALEHAYRDLRHELCGYVVASHPTPGLKDRIAAIERHLGLDSPRVPK